MYLTPSSLSGQIFVPISFGQTELRRGKEIHVASVNLEAGQSLELRSLTLHVVSVLTPGVTPVYYNKSLNLCSVGVYLGPMRCSGVALVVNDTSGAATHNPFTVSSIRTKGTYTVIVGNNTSNVDLSVAVTGVMKISL